MKRKYLLIAALLCATVARAYWVYQATLVNGVVSGIQKFTLDLNTVPNTSGITYVSAQAVYSAAAPSAVTFGSGSTAHSVIQVAANTSLVALGATNNITVAPTASINGSFAHGSLTVISTTAITGVTVYVNGNALVNGTDWFTASTTSGTATSLATAVGKLGGVKAQAVLSVVTATATVVGVGPNSYTLATSNSGKVSVSGANFTGGVFPQINNAYITINGNILKQGYQWYFTGTSSGTATSIAHVLNLMANVKANAVGSIVYSTATVGAAGNAFTLTSSSPTFLTVANPLYTGGLDNATINMAGYSLVQGTDWNAGASTALTAAAITTAINAKAGLLSVVHAQTIGSLVDSTTTISGVAANFGLTTNTTAFTLITGATFIGGTNPGYTQNTGLINTAPTSIGAGMPVTYTSTLVVRPLVNSTVYYVSNPTTTSFMLATTSTGAIAGQFITLLSSTVADTAVTNTLTPLSYSGNTGLIWSASNDGINFNSLPNVSTVTITGAPSGTTSVLWDLGQVNYRYVQFTSSGPAQGGLNLAVTVKGGN